MENSLRRFHNRYSPSSAKLLTMLHITNGDSVAEPLRQLFPEDEVLPWRDVLHEGPVPEKLDAEGLREVRAAFLARRGWISSIDSPGAPRYARA